jgi:hypothetical protein
LTRWLSIQWDVTTDVKLLLRRADGSLEGALRQLKERLPAEFAELFENIGQRHRASAQGRANIFLSTLAETLAPGHFDPPLGDERFCEQYAPHELVGSPIIKRSWDGPSRILRLLEGAEGQRNSASASFDLDDIAGLAAHCGPVIGSGVTGRAEDLAGRLIRESEIIREYRDAGWTAEETAEQAASRLKTSLEFIAVLNRRRNDAIQNVLGVSAAALKTLFRKVRQKLQERGQRLVLLLEDITSWEGLDDSLIDVLVFNAEAKGDEEVEDVCPLISVVGLTPVYYDRLHANYRQRITHEIRLGKSHGGLQDVATLRDAESRRGFVTRYLAAVRAGLPALQRWREEVREAQDRPPPNACDGCPVHDRCFRTFGEHGDVGLFPFTAHAIERFFDALKENDNNQTWRTPRGVLQAILNFNLSQPETLAEGRYPGPLIEPSAFIEDRRSDRALSNLLNRIVATRIQDLGEQARMRRMLAYWANPGRAETTEVEGELAFAGTRRSVFEAFALPWIGEAEPGSSEPKPVAPPPESPLFTLEPEPDTVEPPLGPPSPLRPFAVVRPRPSPVAPKPRRIGPKRSELETHQSELRAWRDGASLDNASWWNRLTHQLIMEIDSARLGVPRALFERLITQEMVKLKGTSSGGRDYLELDRLGWFIDGLEAFLELGAGAAPEQEAELHRENLARMMRRLEQLVRDYIARRLPKLDSGAAWSPVVSLGQVLLARAWLRGAVSPTAPLSVQLRAVLSDETEAQSDPKSRSMPWQDWLTATDKWHDAFRAELRKMVRLTVGDGAGGAGLTDVSELAGALRRMRETGEFDEVPASDGALNLSDLKKVRELAALWREKVALLDRTETMQVRNRADTLAQLLRGLSIKDHLERVNRCVEAVSKVLKTAAPDRVSSWKLSYDKLKGQLEDGAARQLEDLILNLEDPDLGPPPRLAARLGWLAEAPAKQLEEVLALAQAGEKAVEALLTHAEDCIRESSGAASLEEIKAVGRAIREAIGVADAAEKAPAQ